MNAGVRQGYFLSPFVPIFEITVEIVVCVYNTDNIDICSNRKFFDLECLDDFLIHGENPGKGNFSWIIGTIMYLFQTYVFHRHSGNCRYGIGFTQSRT